MSSWSAIIRTSQPFRWLWAAQTISVFGSLITRTALPYVAILTLGASPFQIALLSIAEFVPAAMTGLFVGAWVDRLPRRPVMVAADLGRAGLLASIPVAALFNVLTFAQLLVVAALVSVLTITFTVAYRAILPQIVTRAELVPANSALTASDSAAEFLSFGVGGWLAQLLTAPGAIAVDVVTFVWSAFALRKVQEPTRETVFTGASPGLRTEVADGLRLIFHSPILRTLAASGAALAFSFRFGGTLLLLYLARDLGFGTGLLGMIFAIGGVASLAGAATADRVLARFGFGRTFATALVLAGIGMAFVPLAADRSGIAITLLVGQQLVADWALTVYFIGETSIWQASADEMWQGRLTASREVSTAVAHVAGALMAGLLAGFIGTRSTLFIGAGLASLIGLALVFSPIWHLRSVADIVPAELPVASVSA